MTNIQTRDRIVDYFPYRDGQMMVEDVSLQAIVQAVGTPLYAYSRSALETQALAFKAGVAQAGDVKCAFAVKANPNLAVLGVMARLGFGADVVSAGELERALLAGMQAEDIVFSGVGKSHDEMVLGLDRKIGQFNLESEIEGIELAAIAAARGDSAHVTLRVNPDVDAGTHAKISTGKADNKFGVPIDQAVAIYGRLAVLPGLKVRGIALHIGSQLLSLDPLEAAFTRIGRLVVELRGAGHAVTHVDLGGGLGVRYKEGDVPPTADDYGAMVARVTQDWGVTLMFEPGRVICANAGIMATRVIRVKPGVSHPFVIVDAAMNDLARPALYDAWHDFAAATIKSHRMVANIVGPVCESSDTFAMARDIDAVEAGDLALFKSAGAYGATMASTYNSRPMVPEVMVDGDQWAVVADRIPAAMIASAERVPAFLSQPARGR